MTYPIPGAIDPIPIPAKPLAPSTAPEKIDLVGLPRESIEALLADAGLDRKAARLRSKQLWHWIYHRGVCDFAAMGNIAKAMRPWLAERFTISRPRIVEAQLSSDGTRKWLLAGSDGQEYEMVYIPDEDRGTLCISSQVGCTLNCSFCHTGTMRLVRNLTAGEIVGQFMLARDALGEWRTSAVSENPSQSKGQSPNYRAESNTIAAPDRADGRLATDRVESNTTSIPSRADGRLVAVRGESNTIAVPNNADGRLVTNIVMMGMGEPLYNFEEVKTALHIIMDGDGLALSRRRITLSTSGVVPLMSRVGDEIGVNLAVSLHAVRDSVRDELVPLNRKYNIAALLSACRSYPGATNARRITFEYVMIDGKNDSDADARELVRLLRNYRIAAKVNLIPFNPWPGTSYVCSPPPRVQAFSDIVFQSGISAPIRTPRGRDIMAACGQLKSTAQHPRLRAS